MSGEMHGVEVRGHSLFVDGVEVWQDKNHEPEDMLLSRDLFEFVAVIRRLASERDAQRARAEEAELGCDVLAVGDPYERLAATIEAGKLALRERDAARRKLGELIGAIDAADASSTDARKWAAAYRSLRIAVANARTTES